MDPAHVDALIGSATETDEDEEELVVVEERTDSGSPTSGEYEEFEEFEEVSASSEGAAAPEQLEADFGEMRGKLAALRARREQPHARTAGDRARGGPDVADDGRHLFCFCAQRPDLAVDLALRGHAAASLAPRARLGAAQF